MISASNLPPVLDELHQVFTERGRSLFLVGGAVRSIALGTNPKDWDLCTDAPPEEVIDMFKRTIPTGIEHGTVTVLHRGQMFEVTTFRLDGTYSDARRPDAVTYTSDIIEDLARRDFTMNAMAINLRNHEFLDPFNGQRDLKDRIIRTVGNPLVRFDEDGLRIARGIRFAAQLGFTIEDSTLKAIPCSLDRLAKVSVERFRDEFLKTILAQFSEQGIGLFAELGIFKLFIPELARRFCLPLKNKPDMTILDFLANVSSRLDTQNPALRLVALFGAFPHENLPMEDCANILRRLKFPGHLIRDTQILSAGMFPLPSDQDSPLDCRLRVARVGREYSAMLRQLQDAFNDSYAQFFDLPLFNSQFCQQLQQEHVLAEYPLSIKDLAINGNILQKELDLGPSKLLGLVLERLLLIVLNHPEQNKPDILITLAQEYFQDLKSNNSTS